MQPLSAALFSDSDSNAPPPSPSAGPAGAGQPPAFLRGKRVAVVEDEGITQIQLRNILAHAGLTVVGSARTGEEGVELVLRERPELVIMDIKMPGAIDGIEAARRILAQFHTCIVMLTAYRERQDEAREIGACGYVVKPVIRTTLIPQLEQALKNFLPH